MAVLFPGTETDSNENILEKMIDGIISTMKKYPENEELQVKAIEILNTLNLVFPTITKTYEK